MRNRIVFSSDGSMLLHTTRSGTVALWNIAAAELVARCSGYLVGAARDGRTFLTFTGDETLAWDAHDGSPVPLSLVNPEHYARSERTIVRGAIDGRLTLQLADCFGREPLRSLQIAYSTPTRQAFFECYALLPTGDRLLAVIYGEEAGHTWTRGVCVDSTSGRVIYSFPVSSALTSPPFNVSVQHGVFAISSHLKCFAVYDYLSGRALREVWLTAPGGDAIGIHPSSPWLVAVSQHTARFRDQILYLNIEQLTPSGEVIKVGKIEREIAESGEIAELVFHPRGDFLASLLTGEQIHLWDLGTGHLVGRLPPDPTAG
jgi:WD40 repeat protein